MVYNDFWNDLKPDQKFELEKRKLKLEERKVKIENGLEKHQLREVAFKKITSFSVAICIPLSIIAFGYGISFIISKGNEFKLRESQLKIDAKKMERTIEIEKYRISLETPIRDTIFDTISIVQVKEVLIKKGK